MGIPVNSKQVKQEIPRETDYYLSFSVVAFLL